MASERSNRVGRMAAPGELLAPGSSETRIVALMSLAGGQPVGVLPFTGGRGRSPGETRACPGRCRGGAGMVVAEREAKSDARAPVVRQ